MYPNNAKE